MHETNGFMHKYVWNQWFYRTSPGTPEMAHLTKSPEQQSLINILKRNPLTFSARQISGFQVAGPCEFTGASTGLGSSETLGLRGARPPMGGNPQNSRFWRLGVHIVKPGPLSSTNEVFGLQQGGRELFRGGPSPQDQGWLLKDASSETLGLRGARPPMGGNPQNSRFWRLGVHIVKPGPLSSTNEVFGLQQGGRV